MVKINIPGSDSDEPEDMHGVEVESGDGGRKIDYRCADCGQPVYEDQPAIMKVGKGMVCRICYQKPDSDRSWWKRRKATDPNHLPE